MKASSAIQASETQFLVPLELPGLQGYFGEPMHNTAHASWRYNSADDKVWEQKVFYLFRLD